MEWKRAKTILILSFLCLNILLAYQLWINENNQAGADFETNEITEETHELLKSKGIRIEKEIPKETPTLSEITVRFHDSLNEEILLNTPVKNNLILNKSEFRERLAEEIEHIEFYQLDSVRSSQETHVMNQLYAGLPMFEVNLVLYNKNNEIYAYTQSFVDIETGDEQRGQRILSAYKAVSFLTENYLPINTVIKDVSLGYHGQIYNSESQVLAPKWRIAMEGGDIYYVHGINGAVEVPQKE
jgi:regulatory protein YycI of two-component signal transduction system YycFG